MNNEELAAAIEQAWQLVNKTTASTPTYAPAVEHFNALLKEQQKRAEAGDE